MNQSKGSRKFLSRLIKQAGLVLLLVLYSAAALKIDSIHELLHAREFAELHSVEQELNPCHKTVYHQQAEKGCEHKSHISESNKCSLCEFNVTPDQLTEQFSSQSKVRLSQSKQTVWRDAELTSANIAHTSRGPPANV